MGESLDALWERLPTAFTALLEDLANIIEIGARIEQATDTKMGDWNKIFSSEQFLQFIQDKLGVEGVGKLALILLRVNSINLTNIGGASPDEKLRVAEELRKLLSDIQDITRKIKYAKTMEK